VFVFVFSLVYPTFLLCSRTFTFNPIFMLITWSDIYSPKFNIYISALRFAQGPWDLSMDFSIRWRIAYIFFHDVTSIIYIILSTVESVRLLHKDCTFTIYTQGWSVYLSWMAMRVKSSAYFFTQGKSAYNKHKSFNIILFPEFFLFIRNLAFKCIVLVCYLHSTTFRERSKLNFSQMNAHLSQLFFLQISKLGKVEDYYHHRLYGALLYLQYGRG